MKASIERAALFPLIGAEVREFRSPHVRQVFGEEFRVMYRVHEDSREVLAFVHGSMNIEE